jgi:hypothetical protein
MLKLFVFIYLRVDLLKYSILLLEQCKVLQRHFQCDVSLKFTHFVLYCTPPILKLIEC